jgi:hypothetical protein
LLGFIIPKIMKAARHLLLTTVLACGAFPWSAARADASAPSSAPFLAGSAPDRRPDAAPRILNALALDRRIALHGIAEPPPASLKFLDDQGGWYTPFDQPGMPGRYDLRGWHAAPPSPQPTK